MSKARVRIIATPSKQTMGVKSGDLRSEPEASQPRMREDGFKYIDDFGFRKLGDPLMGYRCDSDQWSSPQDVELCVVFHIESGEHITYAEVKIDQSFHIHEAHIIEGGIGQDHIRILIKARNTYWLRYEARIFGEQKPMNSTL